MRNQTMRRIDYAVIRGVMAGVTGMAPVNMVHWLQSPRDYNHDESAVIASTVYRALSAVNLIPYYRVERVPGDKYAEEPMYIIRVRDETEAEREDREWREWDTESRSRAYDEEAD